MEGEITDGMLQLLCLVGCMLQFFVADGNSTALPCSSLWYVIATVFQCMNHVSKNIYKHYAVVGKIKEYSYSCPRKTNKDGFFPKNSSHNHVHDHQQITDHIAEHACQGTQYAYHNASGPADAKAHLSLSMCHLMGKCDGKCNGHGDDYVFHEKDIFMCLNMETAVLAYYNLYVLPILDQIVVPRVPGNVVTANACKCVPSIALWICNKFTFMGVTHYILATNIVIMVVNQIMISTHHSEKHWKIKLYKPIKLDVPSWLQNEWLAGGKVHAKPCQERRTNGAKTK